MTFAPGDVVTLKSGGHSMTVVSVGEEDVDCLWIGDDGELFRQSIPAVALTAIDLGDDDAAPEDEDEDETEADDDDENGDDEDDDEDDEDEDEQEASGEKRRAERR